MALGAPEKDIKIAETTIEADLNTVNRYFKKWGLQPNPSKTEVTAFHLNNHKVNYRLNIECDGTILKHSRLIWAEHMVRANENYPPKQSLLAVPTGNMSSGRPRLRWIDGVDEKVRQIEVANGQRWMMNRNDWRNGVGKVEA
ncbi:uncharacterized protein [Diabrotica undecimpunctata]|uniref:uncharacterized protein n=1 Tax=Diabrotica undecimpunctata TaxID=50387 RepID=UPI003B6375D6